ncbi:hypothetical protein M426DRAFT_8388 [Hypoxylon sp. CI-4A]|nr:hypothetical protein M426DRAFT_8388 [Hypoxylon sp. CI-4A]
MEQTSTPRISAALMDSFVGRNVIIVGKVVQLRGDTAFLEADGQVQANLNRDCHLMVGNGAQVIGKVNPDYTIKVLNAIDLGSDVGRVSLGWSTGSQQQQSSSQQKSEPQPQFLAQTQSKQKQTLPTVAELTHNTAPTPAVASSSSSQSSRVITPIPPTSQFSQLSIQEASQSSQGTTQPSVLYSTQPSQPPQFSTQDTVYTQHIEEATSSQERQRQKPNQKGSSPEPEPLSPPSPLSPQQWNEPAPLSPSLPSSPINPANSHQDSPESPTPFPSLTKPTSFLSSLWSLPWSTPPPPRRRGRLYRTKSGNLVSKAEIRRRREMEKHADELLETILDGFTEEKSTTVTFGMNSVGRWRIVRPDADEVETYENP